MTAPEAARETWRVLAALMRGYHDLERRAECQGAKPDAAARPAPVTRQEDER